jgi:hypothetical protein
MISPYQLLTTLSTNDRGFIPHAAKFSTAAVTIAPREITLFVFVACWHHIARRYFVKFTQIFNSFIGHSVILFGASVAIGDKT